MVHSIHFVKISETGHANNFNFYRMARIDRWLVIEALIVLGNRGSLMDNNKRERPPAPIIRKRREGSQNVCRWHGRHRESCVLISSDRAARPHTRPVTKDLKARTSWSVCVWQGYGHRGNIGLLCLIFFFSSAAPYVVVPYKSIREEAGRRNESGR